MEIASSKAETFEHLVGAAKCLVFSALQYRVFTFCKILNEMYDACNVLSCTIRYDCNLVYF